MRIVHTEASCGWGGQEIRILEEANGLIARGHQVSLICPKEAPIFDRAAHYGVPAYALPIGRKNIAGLTAMYRWLKNHPVDVVNTHSSTDSWLVGLSCLALSSPPKIVRSRHISAPVSPNRSSRWLYGKSASHVVTTGEKLRLQLIKDLDLKPKNVTSVPTGIDTSRFYPGDKQQARQQLGLNTANHYLGIVATLRSWKGHLFLLEAFERCHLPNWKLLIVGEGPMLTQIQNKIADLNLEDRVELVGQKTNPEDWMRALDLFCLPSYANEGVPQSIMQAMLCGLPVITTPVGAILEAAEENETALVVEPKNVEALIQAINQLAANENLRLSMGNKGRERAVRLFSKDIMLDKMALIFSKVCQRSD